MSHKLPPPIVRRALTNAARQAKLLHQHVHIDVDIQNQTAQGYVDLVLMPLADRIETIHINSKQHVVSHVLVDGIPSRFRLSSSMHDGVLTANGVKLDHVRDSTCIEAAMVEAADRAEMGELAIEIPEEKRNTTKIQMPKSDHEEAEEDSNDEHRMHDDSSTSLRAPLVVRLFFHLSRLPGDRPSVGLCFLPKTPFVPSRAPQCFTTTSMSTPDSPSLWMPCIDGWDERCTWSVDIQTATEMRVVASGSLVNQQTVHVRVADGSIQERMKWSFKLDVPVIARSIGFCIAPFVGESSSVRGEAKEQESDVTNPADEDDEMRDDGDGEERPNRAADASSSSLSIREPAQEWLSVPSRPAGLNKVAESRTAAATLPRKDIHHISDHSSGSSSNAQSSPAPNHAATLSLLRHSVASTVPSIISLYESILGGPYPFGPLKIVFMEEVPSESTHLHFANICIFNRDLLYDSTLIDPVLSTSEALAYSIALNWLAASVVLADPADWWLLPGLAHWMTGVFIEARFGMNERKWRCLSHAKKVMEEEAELAEYYNRNDGGSAPISHGAGSLLHTLHSADRAKSSSKSMSLFLSTPRRLFDSHPLWWPGYLSFTDLDNPLYRAKAHVVVHMMEMKLGGGTGGVSGTGGGSTGGSGSGNASGEGGGGGDGSGRGDTDASVSDATAAIAALNNTGVGLRNLILRVMDEYSMSSSDGHEPRPLTTVRLLELCIEVSSSSSGSSSSSSSSSTSFQHSNIGGGYTLNPDLLQSDHTQDWLIWFEQWIWCNGYPNIDAFFSYNTKVKMSSVMIAQNPSTMLVRSPFTTGVSGNHPDSSWTDFVGSTSNRFNAHVLRFTGGLRFRIVESERINDQERLLPLQMKHAGLVGGSASGSGGGSAAGGVSSGASGSGASFAEIESGRVIEYQFICSSKVRRNRKRKKLDEGALALLPLEKLLVRHNDTPLLYCRIDPAFTWLTIITSNQHPTHQLWKLLHEKEMIGQYDAVMSVARAWKRHMMSASMQHEEGEEGMVGAQPGSAEYLVRDSGATSNEEKLPEDIFAKTLHSTLINPQLYYRIRLAAAEMITNASSMLSFGVHAFHNMKYLHILIDWCRSQYYSNWDAKIHSSLASQLSDQQATTSIALGATDDQHAAPVEEQHPLHLRPNNFSNIQDYLLKKTLPLLVSKVRIAATRDDEEDASSSDVGRPITPGDAIRFILSLLKENDNTLNPFNDCFYLESLIDACGNLRLSSLDSIEPLRIELVRFLQYDQVVPTYRYGITRAALMTLAKLERAGQLRMDEKEMNYERFTAPIHDRSVRLAAFKCIIMLAPIRPYLIPSALNVMEKEECPGLSRRMALHWCKQVIRGTFSLQEFRNQAERSMEAMDRIWMMCIASVDDRNRDAFYRLYRCLWGYGSHTGTTKEQRELASNILAPYRERSTATDSFTKKRINKALQYLVELRAARSFDDAESGAINVLAASTTEPTQAATQPTQTISSGGFKIRLSTAGGVARSAAQRMEDERYAPIDYQ